MQQATRTEKTICPADRDPPRSFRYKEDGGTTEDEGMKVPFRLEAGQKTQMTIEEIHTKVNNTVFRFSSLEKSKVFKSW